MYFWRFSSYVLSTSGKRKIFILIHSAAQFIITSFPLKKRSPPILIVTARNCRTVIKTGFFIHSLECSDFNLFIVFWNSSKINIFSIYNVCVCKTDIIVREKSGFSPIARTPQSFCRNISWCMKFLGCRISLVDICAHHLRIYSSENVNKVIYSCFMQIFMASEKLPLVTFSIFEAA